MNTTVACLLLSLEQIRQQCMTADDQCATVPLVDVPVPSPNATAGNRTGNVNRMAVYSLSERRVGYGTKSKGRCENVTAEVHEWKPCTTTTTTTATTTMSVCPCLGVHD